MAEQRLKGFQVTLEKRAEAEIPSGTVHFRLKLGGDAEGLRAVGYIVQTFLAHHLPRIARKIKLKSFKDYILSNIGADFVWWDFDAPALPANAFPFGHVSLWALMQRRVLLTVAPRSFRRLDFAKFLASSRPRKAGRSSPTSIRWRRHHPMTSRLRFWVLPSTW